jgi:hypothetical protein
LVDPPTAYGAGRTQLIEVIKEVAVIRVRYDYRHQQVLGTVNARG